MEFGSIERTVHVDASPDVVFEVVSSPEHIRDWWSAETAISPESGSHGELVWRDEESGRCDTARITVVDADPPRMFAFRWTHLPGDVLTAEETALLVVFELLPADGGGTLLRMTETGFREQGWEAAVLEEQYRAHEQGWAFYLPRLAAVAHGRSAVRP